MYDCKNWIVCLYIVCIWYVIVVAQSHQKMGFVPELGMRLIILQNFPIIFLRISQEPNLLFLKTKPIVLNKNFTLSLAEKPLCWVNRWTQWTNDYNAKMKSVIDYRRPVEVNKCWLRLCSFFVIQLFHWLRLSVFIL